MDDALQHAKVNARDEARELRLRLVRHVDDHHPLGDGDEQRVADDLEGVHLGLVVRLAEEPDAGLFACVWPDAHDSEIVLSEKERDVAPPQRADGLHRAPDRAELLGHNQPRARPTVEGPAGLVDHADTLVQRHDLTRLLGDEVPGAEPRLQHEAGLPVEARAHNARLVSLPHLHHHSPLFDL